MAEMTYNITLTANHQSLTAEYLPLAAESVQYLTAKVVCETEDWTGREIKAMFGQGCTVHGVPVTGGEITAKQQLNLTAGDWCVWLVGNSARDGEVIPRITTNIAHISVAPTGGTEGNPFPTIPPTVEEQLRADMGNLADLTTEDKSSLVAAINEAAESGGSKDAVTYTPQTLTEEQKSQARTNIGALDVNVGTTPVDTNRTFFGVGKNIVYVKNGWLKPCPADADKELADNYANAVLGFGFINTDISVVKGEAKSAFSLYQQGLISDKGTILKNPLDVAQYITWTVGITNNKTYIDYRHVEHNGFYEYCRYFEDDTYSYPRASYSLSNDMSDSEPRGSVAQYAMSAPPTKDMHVATKQYVDTAKTEAQQLGLTAATPGQIIKVKAVQDGKPTEWEAVDMPGGDKWEKIKEITIAEDAGEANALTINVDENGNTFRLKKARLCAKFPAYTGTSTIPNYSFAMINGKTAGRVTPLLYTSVWPKISTNTITGTIYYVDVSGAQQIEHAQINGNVGWSDDTAHDYAVYGAVGDNQRTMYGDTLWAKPITSIGGTGMLIYPGCHFALYGVRK
jgi:hypothetical protein